MRYGALRAVFEFSLAGLLVGFVVGATGVGGGALMTPILILGFGVPAAVAVGTDLLFAAITKSVGVAFHGQHGTVDWQIVKRMALGSVPASIITTLILAQVGLGEGAQRVMLITLSLAIITTATLSVFKGRMLQWMQREQGTWAAKLRGSRPILTTIVGALIGVLVTLSSVGAGVIGAVALLMLYPRIAAIRVVGTDLAHAVLLTAVAGLGHWGLGTINFSMLGWLLLGSIPGIYLGTRVGLRLPDKLLRPALAGLLVVIGLSLLGNGIAHAVH